MVQKVHLSSHLISTSPLSAASYRAAPCLSSEAIHSGPVSEGEVHLWHDLSPVIEESLER